MKISKQWLVLGIVAIMTFVAFAAIYIIRNQVEPSDPPGYANEISQTQVGQHNKSDSCWIIAGTKVYDVTPNIVSKPDNNKFAAYCGQAFPLPTVEPSKQLADLQNQLNNYYIGILVP